MRLYEDLKKRRHDFGITQLQLSLLSGISLPMIQLIESGEGNPSIKTLTKALHALGLNLNLTEESANWDLLVLCGVPIYAEKNYNISPSDNLLISQLRIAVKELNKKKDNKDGEILRKREAVEAVLLALKNHYPTFYKNRISNFKEIRDFTPKEITERHIKLVRLSTPLLTKYL